MKRTLIALLAFAGIIHHSGATEPSLAGDLGSVLASEELCDLAFNQSAIQAFIEKNVSANDIDFPSTLYAETEVSRDKYK